MAKRVAATAILLLAVAAAAVAPIRSYDFFWNLATGRWIVEHRALPTYDPFTLASAQTPWINGEWLWEVIAYGGYSVAGFHGISLLSAVFIGAIFSLGFWFAARESDLGLALLLAAIAFAGASDRLGVRPAAAAALLVVCALALLASTISVASLTIAYALLTIVWINLHPSALLAPLLAAATLLTDRRRWIATATSAGALLVNPFGWHAVIAPVELTRLVRSGEFVNAEWLPSGPALFPLLYVTAVATLIAFLLAPQKRANAWRLMILVILVALAVQHVRNQGLYFAALPLLFPPIPRLSRYTRIVLAAASIVPLGWVFGRTDHSLGIDPARFPVRAVSRLHDAKLPGNIYNVDQFGGYLEWTFYPQRRVLTDGRNELFRAFIEEDARARHDSRVWHALLQKYQIDLAVDEYQSEKIEVVDVASGERRFLPASLVRYRRRDWALIAFDDAGMVFARRSAFPTEIIARLEYQYLVPDDPQIGYINDVVRNGARAEVARARRELGDLRVVRELERGTGD
jgi:hypothetical protein